MSILSALNPLSYVEPVLNAGNNIYKSIAGSKEQEDAQAANATAAAQEEYAAEFQSEKTGFFSNFMDAVNRIPRPLLTFYFCWLILVLPIYDLPLFQKVMMAYTYVPQEMWYIGLTIVGFFFGGRMQSVHMEAKKAIAQAAAAQPVQTAPEWVDPDATTPLDWIENKTIAAWKATKNIL